jgi:diguanylate cyclase (GGDEF)-like protein
MPYTRSVGRRYSLRRDLTILVVVCVVPAVLVSAVFAYTAYRSERENVEQQTVLVANEVMADLNREMAVIESGLKVLATSEEIVAGNFRGFHERARNALAPGIMTNYILTDPQGQQIINTLRPFGSELPKTGTPPQLSGVFSQKTTVLTDLFIGPVVRRPVIAMGVPVGSGDAVAYSLNVGLDPQRISAVLERHPMPEGWLAAVLDSSGTIVARSRDAEKFVGQKAVPVVLEALATRGSGPLESTTKDGVPVYSALNVSPIWKWSVIVGAPKAVLQREMRQQLVWVVVALLAAFTVGLWVARKISLRVITSVEHLSEAVESMGKGEALALPAIHLQEATGLENAMEKVGKTIRKVKFDAQHDALTALPNRLLFDEVAQRSLVFAQRHEKQLALLAIDLDGFKAVNDTQGHAAGDEVLVTVAKRMVETIRGSDIAARLGGDEFLVLLNDVTVETAMETAQRLVDSLAKPYPASTVAVSASVGVAMYPLNAPNLLGLMHRADKALYAAKAQGKHCAVLATET